MLNLLQPGLLMLCQSSCCLGVLPAVLGGARPDAVPTTLGVAQPSSLLPLQAPFRLSILSPAAGYHVLGASVPLRKVARLSLLPSLVQCSKPGLIPPASDPLQLNILSLPRSSFCVRVGFLVIDPSHLDSALLPRSPLHLKLTATLSDVARSSAQLFTLDNCRFNASIASRSLL